jgi:hypothetical protein
MKRIITLIAIAFLVSCSIVFWTNYVNPCKETNVIFVDTCGIDSVIVNSIVVDTITK